MTPIEKQGVLIFRTFIRVRDHPFVFFNQFGSYLISTDEVKLIKFQTDKSKTDILEKLTDMPKLIKLN